MPQFQANRSRRVARRRPNQQRSVISRAKPYLDAGLTAAKIASTAAMAAKALSMLNTEHKYVDVTGTPTQATASLTLLNPLSQGTTAETRIGDQVKFKSLDMRIATSNGNAETIWMRYMIIKDNAPNGAVPTEADILADTGGPVQSFRNLDYGKRFVVYADKVLSYSAHNLANSASQPSFINFHIDLERPKRRGDNNITEYGLGNAGTIADISKGAYYLLCTSSAVSNNVTFSFGSRMRYIDN